MSDDGISLILEADSLSPSEPEEETPEEEIEEEVEEEEVEEEPKEPEEEPEPPAEDEKYASLEAKYNALLQKFQELGTPAEPQPSATPATTDLPELDDEAYDTLLRGDAAAFNKHMKQIAESVQAQTLKSARENILGEIDPIFSTRYATERFFEAPANSDLKPFRVLVGQAINQLIAEKADIKDVNTALEKAGERVRESLALVQKNKTEKEKKKKKPALPGSRTSPRKQQKSGEKNRTTQMLEDIAAVMTD